MHRRVATVLRCWRSEIRRCRAKSAWFPSSTLGNGSGSATAEALLWATGRRLGRAAAGGDRAMERDGQPLRAIMGCPWTGSNHGRPDGRPPRATVRCAKPFRIVRSFRDELPSFRIALSFFDGCPSLRIARFFDLGGATRTMRRDRRPRPGGPIRFIFCPVQIPSLAPKM